jgi:hypothetical protein
MPGPHNEENGRHYCEYWQTIPPNWPTLDKAAADYEFLCVDGGVMNNEPLDLARQILTGPGGTDPSGNPVSVHLFGQE